MLGQSKLAVTALIAYVVFNVGLSALVSTESVRTKQFVIVTLGHNATLSCELIDPKNVLQVTWQRVTSTESIENVATYSKLFGAKVKHAFKEHMQLLEDGTRRSSLLIRGVRKRDHGSCYKCLFNTYPDGAISANTCLHVNEPIEPSIIEFERGIAEMYRSGGLTPSLSSVIFVTALCTHILNRFIDLL